MKHKWPPLVSPQSPPGVQLCVPVVEDTPPLRVQRVGEWEGGWTEQEFVTLSQWTVQLDLVTLKSRTQNLKLNKDFNNYVLVTCVDTFGPNSPGQEGMSRDARHWISAGIVTYLPQTFGGSLHQTDVQVYVAIGER